MCLVTAFIVNASLFWNFLKRRGKEMDELCGHMDGCLIAWEKGC